MAGRLKHENDIVTLKVELTGAGQVSCMLQSLDDAQLRSKELWKGRVDEFGVPGDGSPPSEWVKRVVPKLPTGLQKGLARSFVQYARRPGQSRHKRILWVHLVKPYGALRFVPWERLILDVLKAPVFMLPDFIFPAPRKSLADLDVAICASAPLGYEHHWVIEGLLNTIDAIAVDVSHQPRRIHVFAESEMVKRVRELRGASDAIKFHPPEDAAPYVSDDVSSRQQDASGSLRSPWLLWMRQALRAYSTDVVHFVCHGHLSGRNGAMLFAQSPIEPTANYLAGPVGAVELASFMTQVGAWATAFTSPQDNHSPDGLRAIADEIGQSLPGPMLLYDPRFDDASGTLEKAYRFLHAESPQSPPCSAALYLYCQPYLLEERAPPKRDVGLLNASLALSTRNEHQRDLVLKSIAGSDVRGFGGASFAASASRSISAVTAATERVAEQVQLRYQKVLRDDAVPSSIATRDLYTAMGTVNRIRDAVTAMEQQRLLQEIGTRLDEVEQTFGGISMEGEWDSTRVKPISPGVSNLSESLRQDLRADIDAMKSVDESWAQMRELGEFPVVLVPPMVVQIERSSVEERTGKIRAHITELEEKLLGNGTGAEP